MNRSLISRSGDGVAQDAAVLAALEDALGLALELPNPLARDLQLVPELGQRCRVAVVEAVAPDQDVPRPLGQPLYGLLEVVGLHLSHHFPRSVRGPLVL